MSPVYCDFEIDHSRLQLEAEWHYLRVTVAYKTRMSERIVVSMMHL